jgi:hypothetical protein
MTIAASVPQTIPLRANLFAATAALAHMAGRALRPDQSSSINKAALDSIYLLNRRRSIEQTISSIRHPSDRAAPKSKSP